MERERREKFSRGRVISAKQGEQETASIRNMAGKKYKEWRNAAEGLRTCWKEAETMEKKRREEVAREESE